MCSRDITEYGFAATGVAPVLPEVLSIFPWARSVIVAAVSYLPPEPQTPGDGARGLVARFARGVDYHDVLTSKLGAMADSLRRANPHHRFEVCVDTTLIPERKLAVLAGVGWRGKNACVFVEGCGSYVALGEVVTDLELPASTPADIDLCGDCEQCMRACPTGAITARGVVDRSRCLSELTQAGGAIPRELRPLLGNRVYGCDVCQEVCPRNAEVTTNPEFAPDAFPGAYPAVMPLIEISARGFLECVKPSPIGWIGRTRIRRNAVVAAGNIRCKDAVPALIEAMGEESATLRGHAAWALGEIGGGKAARGLRERLRGEHDAWVREEMELALSNL